MTEQDKKQQAIDELKKILIDHLKKAYKIGRSYKYYSPKKPATTIKRVLRMMQFFAELRSLAFQIQLVKSQLIPNFIKGGIAHTGEIIEQPNIINPIHKIISEKETLKILNKKL